MFDEFTIHVAILIIEAHIAHSNSLKSKRSVIKGLKDRIHSKFNVSVAEIAENDKWQRAILALSMIGNDQQHLDRSMQSILSLAQAQAGFQVVRTHLEFI